MPGLQDTKKCVLVGDSDIVKMISFVTSKEQIVVDHIILQMFDTSEQSGYERLNNFKDRHLFISIHF